MKTLLTLAVTFCFSMAFAIGQDRGNGGDAVVCYTNATRSKITSVRMFDYWEQEQVLNYGHAELGSPQISIQDKIEIATKRISKFDPNLGGQIRQMALNLANNIQNYLVTSYDLPEIDDAHPRAIPTEPNCYIEQYAVQYKDLITGQRRFSIADKFYNHANTSNNDRVGIILHEAIYRYAIQLNPSLSSSDDVRYFNYIVGSAFLDSLKIQNIDLFHDILVKTKIIQSECALKDGIYLKPTYDSAKSISCYNQNTSLKPNISVGLTQGTMITNYVMIPSKDNPSSSYPVKGIKLEQQDRNLPLVIEVNYGGQAKKFLTNTVSLTEDSLKLESMSVNNDPTFTTQTIKGPGGTDFVCQFNLSFDVKSLALISCYIQKTQVVANSQTLVLSDYMQQLSGDRWIISPANSFDGSKVKFNLLGSKKSSAITSYRGQYRDANTTCKDDLMTVDGAYNVVAGCFKSEYSMEVNGQVVGLLNNFEVQWINGEYFLKGQVAYNRNTQGIYNPTFKNLRLIKTSQDEKFNYCGTLDFPSKKTWVWGATAEYVGYPGESFYDMSTDSIVYKSDENVSVVTRVGCQATDFLSNNY